MKHSIQRFMSRISLFLAICSPVFASAQLDYLAERAVCFSNGTHIYKENGKYGFENFEEKLSLPAYDTIFHFGKRYCVVKQGDAYFVLGENLEKRFNQPIRYAERKFVQRINTYVELKVITANNEELCYTIDYSDSEPLIYVDSESWKSFQFYPSPTAVIAQPISYRDKAFDPNNYTQKIYEDDIQEKWVDSIHFSKDTAIYYLQNGKKRIQKRPGYTADYIGRHFFVLSTETNHLVHDIVSGDTVLKLPKSATVRLIYNNNEPFFEVIDYPNNLTNWKSYDLTGKLISSLQSESTIYYEDGLIYETFHRITTEGKDDKTYPYYRFKHCNLYRFKDVSIIGEDFIEIDNASGIRIFKARKGSMFYVFAGSELLDSITQKEPYMSIDLDWDYDHRFFGICNGANSESITKTRFYTSEHGFLKEYSGFYEIQLNQQTNNYLVYSKKYDKKRTYESEKLVGFYDSAADTLLFNENTRAEREIFPGIFVSGDTTNRLTDFNGNSVLDGVVQDYDHFELSGQRYVSMTIDYRTAIYTNDFKRITEVESFKLGDRYILTKKINDPGYVLLNANLEQKSKAGKFIEEVSHINSQLVVLYIDKTIDYLNYSDLNQ